MSKYLLVELYEDANEEEIRDDVREIMSIGSVSSVHQVSPIKQALSDDEYLRLIIGNPGMRALQ